MAFEFDKFTTPKQIRLTTTDRFTVNAMYAAFKTWYLSNMDSGLPALSVVGGNKRDADTLKGDDYFLRDDWQIVPHDSNHRLIVDGGLYPETDSCVDLFYARPGRTILIDHNQSSLALTKVVSTGSGVTAQDKVDIAAGTKAAILSDGVAFPGARIDAAVSSRSVAGDGLTVEQAAILVQLEVMTAELHKLRGLAIGSPVVATETSVTVGTIEQEITTALDGSVTLERVA